MGVIKGDTRSLDYSSYASGSGYYHCGAQVLLWVILHPRVVGFRA